MATKQFQVGETYWLAHGTLFGREEIIGEPCDNPAAEAAARSWLSGLSDREAKGAMAWIMSYRVQSIDENGGIESAKSFGRGIEVSL